MLGALSPHLLTSTTTTTNAANGAGNTGNASGFNPRNITTTGLGGPTFMPFQPGAGGFMHGYVTQHLLSPTTDQVDLVAQPPVPASALPPLPTITLTLPSGISITGSSQVALEAQAGINYGDGNISYKEYRNLMTAAAQADFNQFQQAEISVTLPATAAEADQAAAVEQAAAQQRGEPHQSQLRDEIQVVDQGAATPVAPSPNLPDESMIQLTLSNGDTITTDDMREAIRQLVRAEANGQINRKEFLQLRKEIMLQARNMPELKFSPN